MDLCFYSTANWFITTHCWKLTNNPSKNKIWIKEASCHLSVSLQERKYVQSNFIHPIVVTELLDNYKDWRTTNTLETHFQKAEDSLALRRDCVQLSSLCHRHPFIFDLRLWLVFVNNLTFKNDFQYQIPRCFTFSITRINCISIDYTLHLNNQS